MAGNSKIEWTEQTWNPFAGCAVLSPGCTNCYAMKMAARLDAMGQQLYKGLTKPSKAGPVWRGSIRTNPEALLAPLRRKKPTTYFVNSMSDLFYEKFDDDLIDQVFAVMALSPQHIFQVLTKRAERMRAYMTKLPDRHESIGDKMMALRDLRGCKRVNWPFPNVWLGLSAERQKEADERIPLLLQTPAAIRFVSCEPLLGQIYLTRCERGDATVDAMSGEVYYPGAGSISSHTLKGKKLDWVIVGGESGPSARPMHPEWAQSLRDQCAAAGAPFFFKQWGEWSPVTGINVSKRHALFGVLSKDAKIEGDWGRALDFFQKSKGVNGCAVLAQVGKRSAGRLLDGQEHNAMPKVAA